MRKSIRCVTVWLAVLLVTSLFTFPVCAESYVVESDGRTRISTPDAYEVKEVLLSFQDGEYTLKEPSDLFIDESDNLYIADTGNNRIVKLDAQGKFVAEYVGDGLQSPQGVYVDSYGDMFVADTLNQRIVHLDINGAFIETFVKPDTTLIDDANSFSVSKLYIDSQGYIYVLDGKQFMLLDAENNFKGFVGSNRLGFDLKRLLIRLFATKEQKEKLTDEEPVSYNNFMIGKDGMIYAVTAAAGADAIKKITPAGNNAFTSDFQMEQIKIISAGTVSYESPIYTDIAVDAQGIITVLEQKSKRLYQYDQNGNMICSFGGEGNKQGLFVRPVSIAVNSVGDIYVLDQSTGYIHIFTPTNFSKMVNTAVYLFSEGRYEEAMTAWREVLQVDAYYPLANNGMGDCLLRTEKYEEAMACYELTENYSRYGEAFSEYRYGIFREYFFPIVLGLFIILVGAVLLIRLLKGRAETAEKGYYFEGKRLQGAHLSLMLFFHPITVFHVIKRERASSFRWISAAIIFLSTFLVNYSYAFITNVQVSGKSIQDVNLALEIGMTFAPLLLWTVASYAMTSILGGECTLRETMTANMFCLVPFCVFSIILSAVSNVMSASESGIYTALRLVIIFFVLVLLFTALKTLNDSTLPQALGVAVLSLIAMAILMAVILLVVSLSIQFYDFLATVWKEVSQKYFL